jgi:hypothetical protein
MDMKIHMLNSFSYPCWWIGGKKKGNYKMEVVIRKGKIYIFSKIIKKRYS